MRYLAFPYMLSACLVYVFIVILDCNVTFLANMAP
jgi:hypothetical protein